MKAQELYDSVTARIVTQMESGQADGKWTMPWSHTGTGTSVPSNATTGRAYSGGNWLMLYYVAEERGLTDNRWATYKQWLGLNPKGKPAPEATCVRKGSKGVPILTPMLTATVNDDGEKEFGKMYFGVSYVFNIADVDNVPERFFPKVDAPAEEPTVNERIAHAQAFFKSDGMPGWREMGNSSYYASVADWITLPELASFKDSAAFYATLSHEHAHWTGHKTRLDRQFGTRYGDDAYAMEELVAELSAAFTCATLGIPTVDRPDHAQYLKGWIKVLKADTRAIFTAASAAQKATDYLTAIANTSDAKVDAHADAMVAA